MSIIEERDSVPSDNLIELFKERDIEYDSLDTYGKIDILTSLFVDILVNGNLRTFSNLIFLLEITSELIMNVPTEEFKIIYEDIMKFGTENIIKNKHIDRLYSKYPQNAELFIEINTKTVTKKLIYNEQLSFKELTGRGDESESDLIITFKGNNISIYQNQADGDTEFYYFDCELIQLFQGLYFKTREEIFIINLMRPELIEFRCINKKKTYNFNGEIYKSSKSKKEAKLNFPDFSFTKQNNNWVAQKKPNAPYLLRAFHSKFTSTENSETIKIDINTKRVVVIKRNNYSISYS